MGFASALPHTCQTVQHGFWSCALHLYLRIIGWYFHQTPDYITTQEWPSCGAPRYMAGPQTAQMCYDQSFCPFPEFIDKIESSVHTQRFAASCSFLCEVRLQISNTICGVTCPQPAENCLPSCCLPAGLLRPGISLKAMAGRSKQY